MSTSLISLILFFTTFTYADDPTPPTSWPATWHTWVTVTVVVDQPVLIRGQLIAFDSNNLYVCRYNQQNLLNVSSIRWVDMCDWTSGYHWSINSTDLNSYCSGTMTLASPMQTPVYPDTFLASAKFIGVDPVAQQNCNHFVALDIIIDNKTQQMDLWSAVDTGYPCQISLFEMDSNIHKNWAFDGFSDYIPPEAYECTAPKLLCDETDYVCHAKRGLDPDELGKALQWVCDPTRVNCSAINPLGDHFIPNTVESHCDWAFNVYFQIYKGSQGVYACYFNGVAELVPSKKRSVSVFYQKSVSSLFNSLNLVC